MKNKKTIIVGIGELLWDVLPTGKRAGGAPVNVIYHASRLGAEGYAISAIGNDILGDDLLKAMSKNNINYIVPRVSYPTGTVQVKLIEGTPIYDIIENVAWDYIPITAESKDIVSKADAIAYGTLAQRNNVSLETISQLLRFAPNNALKFYDINLRQNYYTKELITKTLELSNILKINDEELEILKPMFYLQNASNERFAQSFITRFGLKYFILTAGSKYSSIYQDLGNGRKLLVSTIKTPKVEVIDTVGAGDAFSGAFLYSILSGKTLSQAHQKAVEIGAFVCKHAGAWPKY